MVRDNPFFYAPTAMEMVFDQSVPQTCRLLRLPIASPGPPAQHSDYGANFDFPGSLSTNLLPRWGIDLV